MDPDALYEIHIDNDGDAVENLTYQFKFTNTLKNGTGLTLQIGDKTLPIALREAGPSTATDQSNLSETESYTVTQIVGDRRAGTRGSITTTTGSSTFTKPVDNIGNKSIADYNSYAGQYVYNVTIPSCSTAGKVFVGQRAEAFAVNLGEVFDLVNFVRSTVTARRVTVTAGAFPAGSSRAATMTTSSAKEERHLDRDRAADRLPRRCRQRRDRNLVDGQPAAGRVARSDPDLCASGGAGRRLCPGFAPRHAAGQRTGDRAQPEGSVQRRQAEGRCGAGRLCHQPDLPAILDKLFRTPVNATLGTNISNLAPNNFPRADLVATF